MKQLIGFCLLGVVVVIAMTVVGFVIAFRDFNSDEFFARIEQIKGEEEVVDDIPQDPQYGWNVDGARSARRVVLNWTTIEPVNDAWNFVASDAAMAIDGGEPIAILFSDSLASPTPPWSEEFTPELGPEADDYLSAVVRRYADQVTYWQIGDKMDVWRPNETLSDQPEFSIEQQAAFLSRAAEIVRENDEDAIIVMPGMSVLSSYTIDEWFGGILTAVGNRWFDVVAYYYEGEPKSFYGQREVLGASLTLARLEDRPVWLLNTSPDLSIIAQAYGSGDSLVAWTESTPQINSFVQDVLPFSEVEEVSRAFNGVNLYRFVTASGEEVYVAWGIGEMKPPAATVQAGSGQVIQLSDVPVMIR